MCINPRHALGILCLLLLTNGHAWAQAPRMDLLSDGVMVIGIVTRADGSPAANQAVMVENLSDTVNAAQVLMTDEAGVFVFSGAGLSDYRANVVINGAIGSATVTTGEAPPPSWEWPPIYVTLAILMLLSLIPARLLRRPEFRKQG